MNANFYFTGVFINIQFDDEFKHELQFSVMRLLIIDGLSSFSGISVIN